MIFHLSRTSQNKQLASLLVGFMLLAGSVVLAQSVELTVQAGQPGKAISPYLMGIFFEDLNYAADGGLYAELIQNRSFEYSPTERSDWHPLAFWELQKRGDGDGSVSVSNARPIHVNNPTYALLQVRTPGDGVGIANSGFGGIPLKEGQTYNASFWAYQAFMGIMWERGDHSKPMPVTLRLETRDGQVLAEAKTEILGRQWRQVSMALTPTRTVNDARLVLLAHEQGGICIDMVSLFPENTFRNRPNGLRADLAQAIADINPKFVRFPGGCLVHAGGIRRYYNWKDTIGPLEQRRSGPNYAWGYHQSKGLGYFEYFQFCKDIGAKPIPIVSAGVSCQHAGHSPGRGQEGLPMDEMPAYIQDVLDLIEWANGPATSKWGAKRAAAGHPEPFGLKYLGVGNEEAVTPLFEERFKMIYEAIKEKHPEIVVIGTSGPFASGEDFDNGWAFAKELNLEMVDEHYYVSPQWFWDNLNRYDTYDRNHAKVYVGEYAAHDRGRRNTLRSAIAEAAGLTGFERNGDVVWFTSYAPLLARRGHTQWEPDLIYFDATNVYLSANYYVQQLFGQNSGDRYLDTVFSDGDTRRLAASSVRDSKTGDVIVKIVNGNDSPREINVQLDGLPSDVSMDAVKTVLTGPDPDAVNEDGKTPVIKPETSSRTIKSGFSYSAPANSLTVFRITLAQPCVSAIQELDAAQVRLLPGSPFYERQELHRSGYVGGLDPDRLLFHYRELARLPQPQGVTAGYGSWDSGFIRGHMAGHYLSAASRMAAGTGDVSFKDKAEYIVAELAKCQAALNQGGYLAAFPIGAFEYLEGQPADNTGVVVPYYTVHKIMAGLLDAYCYLGNTQALDVAVKMADYFEKRLAALTPQEIERIFRTDGSRNPHNEFGAMSDALAALYSITGEKKYLVTAQKFNRPWFIDPLAAGEDKLTGLHANTHIAQAVGIAHYANLTGSLHEQNASKNFWEMVTQQHSFVIGGNSFKEWFDKPGVETGPSIDDQKSLPATTAESCNTHNMLKLTARLFERAPRAEYADYFERALYNHLLATVAPDTGAVTYFTPLYGHFRTYLDGTHCCVGTGIENASRYNEGIYFGCDNTLWINLYIPSELNWQDAELVLRQEGDITKGEPVRLTIVQGSEKSVTLNFRIPHWISGPALLTLNGEEMTRTDKPSAYVALNREWKTGDVVTLTLPAELRLEHAKDSPSMVSVFWGPVLLAGELGRENMPNDHADKDAYLRRPPVPVPEIKSASANPADWLEPVTGEPLVFKARGAGPADGILFRPLYELHRQRYSVYWNFTMYDGMRNQ